MHRKARPLWEIFAEADRAATAGAVCLCGHHDNEHINGRGPCDIQADGRYCGCTRLKVA